MNEKKIYSERMDLIQMTYIHIPNSICKLILIIVCGTYNHVFAYVFVLHCVKTTFQSHGPKLKLAIGLAQRLYSTTHLLDQPLLS